MTENERISGIIRGLARDIERKKDSEVSEYQSCAVQYITDHRDRDSYRAIERNASRLARAYDRMVKLLDRTALNVELIEDSVTSFYGD